MKKQINKPKFALAIGKKTAAAIVVTGCLVTFNANAQTVLSGSGTNSCSTPAGTGSSTDNTSIGCGAGAALTTGASNTFVGYGAGSNTNGDGNTYVGDEAGNVGTTGGGNSAFGSDALNNNNADNNSAFGLSALSNNTSGTENNAFGTRTLGGNITGNYNAAFGNNALLNNTASDNSAFGYQSLYNNTSGTNNSVFGYKAGYYNQYGFDNAIFGDNAGGTGAGAVASFNWNSFFGSQAAYNMKAQGGNTAMGYQSLYSQNYGSSFTSYNVAIGYQSLFSNNPTSTSNGQWNNALGSGAGYSNSTGQRNNFFGTNAGYYNTIGNYNYYLGTDAGYYNTTGSYNVSIGDASGIGASGVTTYSFCTFLGQEAGHKTTTGNNNIYIGFSSGYTNSTGANNTAVGYQAGYNWANSNNNTFIGNGADANSNSLSDAAAIGNGAVTTANDNIVIGITTIAKVGGWVNWTNYSDGRFKTNVTENVHGLDFINKLRPVTYNIDTKKADDFVIQNMSDSAKNIHQSGVDFSKSSATIHSGFIAQEVEQAAQQTGFSSSIVYHPQNATDPYALAYSEFVVPLVKAVQELSHTVDSLKTALSQSSGSNNRTLQNNTNSTDTSAKVGAITTVNTIDLTSNNAIIYQNAPNPFGDGTTIKYYVPDNATNAQIVFFNEFGSQLNTFAIKETGNGQLNIVAGNLAAGTYSYSLIINGKAVDTKKMIKQ